MGTHSSALGASLRALGASCCAPGTHRTGGEMYLCSRHAPLCAQGTHGCALGPFCSRRDRFAARCDHVHSPSAPPCMRTGTDRNSKAANRSTNGANRCGSGAILCARQAHRTAPHARVTPYGASLCERRALPPHLEQEHALRSVHDSSIAFLGSML